MAKYIHLRCDPLMLKWSYSSTIVKILKSTQKKIVILYWLSTEAVNLVTTNRDETWCYPFRWYYCVIWIVYACDWLEVKRSAFIEPCNLVGSSLDSFQNLLVKLSYRSVCMLSFLEDKWRNSSSGFWSINMSIINYYPKQLFWNWLW